MLKLVILVCALHGPCEYKWWNEPFRTAAGCYVAGFVAAHDWLRAHEGFVLRGRSCEPIGVVPPEGYPNTESAGPPN